MNFITFQVGTTNIFPASNSTAGGQYLTEYNLRSRESVGIGPYDSASAVSYMIGPSFVHSEDDFVVSIQSDSVGRQVSSSVLQISEGRGLINGYYVQTLAPMIVDLAEGNMKAKLNGQNPLTGKLAIGLRIMFSTETTVAGSIKVENKDDMYEGVQVVVLPVKEFILPTDTTNASNKTPGIATAHIKLAEFTYVNGKIGQIIQNYPNKCKSIDGSRIANIDQILSDSYVTRNGLDENRLYTFSGKSTKNKNTWCDSTDSLMVWDNNPQLKSGRSNLKSAKFTEDETGKVNLLIPHKQVDGSKSVSGESLYYPDVKLPLPTADFGKGSSGVVDRNYTKNVKQVLQKINNFYHLPSGHQVYFLDTLENKEDLPKMNSKWQVGDYIIVRSDTTNESNLESNIAAPSTMYVILPGRVEQVSYVSKNTTGNVPDSLSGVEIMKIEKEKEPPMSGDKEMNDLFDIEDSDNLFGQVNKDYFVITNTKEDNTTYYFYKVSKMGAKQWSEPLFLTSEFPLASETHIGGFLDVPETYLDAGYVKVDENGNLRVLDYTLLRSGVLAYQLGEDVEIPNNTTSEGIQEYLDEYVNQRVVFPNANHLVNSTNPSTIEVTMTLPKEDVETHISVQGIDSRFGTSLTLTILGDADSNTIIHISDCEKIRINNNNSSGDPIIQLSRCNLYYDPAILNQLKSIKDMKLWYEKFNDDDPNLMVNDMTVQSLSSPDSPEEIDYWSELIDNDNHYVYALRSITFSPSGAIVGCSLYVANKTTTNIDPEQSAVIVSKFTLPQGIDLIYPEKRLIHKLKVTGSFINTYNTDSGLVVLDTNFTAITQKNDPISESNTIDGVVSFFSKSTITNNVHYGVNLVEGTIEGWGDYSYHIFSGGVVD